MKRLNMTLRVCILFVVFCLFPYSDIVAQQQQQEIEKHRPTLGAGVSALKFTGDVGQQTDVSPLLDVRLGAYVVLEQRVGKLLGFSLGGWYGKLAGTDNSRTSHLNFEATAMTGEFLVSLNFDRVMKHNLMVSPFVNFGVGYMMFQTKADLKNGTSTKYNYWADGSIRDLPETPVNVNFANVIKRDYSYETVLNDSANSVKSSLTVPVGLGMKFHMGPRFTSTIGFNYVLILSDKIDNRVFGTTDSYLQANVGLQFELKKKMKAASDGVDFNLVDNYDADGDGVGDNKDNCLGTPKGILVDSHGCPFDTDADGVPDYLDKEPKSKKGSKVDGMGITIDEIEMGRRQLEWDSLAGVRSDRFNDAPSLDYLKEVETMAKEVKKDTPKNKVPEVFRSADKNDDGYISAGEITETIDGFFEGSNDYTVDKINKLIDYFFEQ